MRIRTIKPEFWQHPVMARLPDDFQLIALGLLSAADDEGYFRADPSIIRGEIAPFRENLARISEALASLSAVGWIALSEHPEQGKIGKICKWSDHQRVDHPSPSKLKTYFLARDSRETRERLAPDQGSGIREHNNTPIPPNGGDLGLEVQTKFSPEFVAIQSRINRIKRREETTRWSQKEIRALKQLLPIPEEDFAAVERYYAAIIPKATDYRRHDVATLLNNWAGEVDRAKQFKPNPGF